jgi:hypothetical protein
LRNLTLEGLGPVFFLGFSAGWFARSALSVSTWVKNEMQAGQYGGAGESAGSAGRTKLFPQRSQSLHWTTIAAMNAPFLLERNSLKLRAKPGVDNSQSLS